MEFIKIFNQAPAAALLSNDGVCGTDQAVKVVNNIKTAAKSKQVFITYWNDGKVTFTSIYSHTAKVPAKALKDLATFEAWNIERINHYFAADGKKMRYHVIRRRGQPLPACNVGTATTGRDGCNPA